MDLWDDGQCLLLTVGVWDPRYASLAPLYYRGASAAVVVYDLTSRDTFTKAKHWTNELRKNANGNIGAPLLSDFEAIASKLVAPCCALASVQPGEGGNVVGGSALWVTANGWIAILCSQLQVL